MSSVVSSSSQYTVPCVSSTNCVRQATTAARRSRRRGDQREYWKSTHDFLHCVYTGFGWFLHGPPPNGDCWLTFPICSTNTQSCGMVVGYPLAQLLDLRVDVSAIARACRFQGTLTDPERFDSPEIVLEKHDFSYPDCTQSFFCYCEDEDDGTLLRVEQQNTTARYTVAARTLRHGQRVSCHGRHGTNTATLGFMQNFTHAVSVRPSSAAVRCTTTTPSASCRAEGSCVCTQRLD